VLLRRLQLPRMIPVLLPLTWVALSATACIPPESKGGEPPAPEAVNVPASGELDRGKIRVLGGKQAYDVNPGASDQEVLDSGAVAVIEPQEGVYRLDTLQLKRGYVVARFHNLSNIAVPRLGLAPGGTTFWVVYQKAGEFVSAYIADSDSSSYDRVDIPMVIHPPSRPWRQSIAQWQLPGVLHSDQKQGMGALGLTRGSQPWVSCVTAGCCTPI
jgi:hypothetical protein